MDCRKNHQFGHHATRLHLRLWNLHSAQCHYRTNRRSDFNSCNGSHQQKRRHFHSHMLRIRQTNLPRQQAFLLQHNCLQFGRRLNSKMAVLNFHRWFKSLRNLLRMPRSNFNRKHGKRRHKYHQNHEPSIFTALHSRGLL
jgi:hypothetical protein